MQILQSRFIEAVVYDEARRQLHIKFRRSGRMIVYENVPQSLYDSMIFADSIGAFFAERIEGRFRAHFL